MYGLIVTGVVLVSTPEDELRLLPVALTMLGTLLIYWFAETYTYWMSARAMLQRRLIHHERMALIRDGLPLVTACGIPLAFLGVLALTGVGTARAVQLTLILNAALLFAVGWRTGRAARLTGVSLVLATVSTGLLGVALVALKASLQH
jgi:hypothetical protein